jgi:hypothetical protein
MFTLKRLCVALSLVAFASSAFADSYKFHLANKTTKYTITGFQTYENGSWSTWSGVSLAPGDEQDMDWGSSEGKCVVPFRVVYAEIQSDNMAFGIVRRHSKNLPIRLTL